VAPAIVNSYSARLVALLLAAVLPVVAIATALVVHAARQERRTIEAETAAKVGHLVDLVNREITADLRVLEALATSASLDGPDLQRFHDQARRVLASQPDWLTLLLLDREGWQLMSARQPLGREPVRVVEPRSFEETVRTGSATVGPLSEPSPASGIRAVPLRVPVWRDGQLRHVLTAPVKADSFGRLLSAGSPVDGWVAAVADQNGRLVARSRDLEAQAGRPLDAEAIAAIRSGTPGGLYWGKGLDGADVIATFATVGETGWTVHLGVPPEAYEGPRRRAILAAALGGLGCVALAAALAWLIRRDLAARRREEASSRQVRAMEAIGRMTEGGSGCGLGACRHGSFLPFDSE
jgi:hypothetical protein